MREAAAFGPWVGPNRARKRGREGRACRANDDDNDGVLVGRKGGGRSRNNLGQSKHLLVRKSGTKCLCVNFFICFV